MTVAQFTKALNENYLPDAIIQFQYKNEFFNLANEIEFIQEEDYEYTIESDEALIILD